jgi:hypothetical protein
VQITIFNYFNHLPTITHDSHPNSILVLTDINGILANQHKNTSSFLSTISTFLAFDINALFKMSWPLFCFWQRRTVLRETFTPPPSKNRWKNANMWYQNVLHILLAHWANFSPFAHFLILSQILAHFIILFKLLAHFLSF